MAKLTGEIASKLPGVIFSSNWDFWLWLGCGRNAQSRPSLDAATSLVKSPFFSVAENELLRSLYRGKRRASAKKFNGGDWVYTPSNLGPKNGNTGSNLALTGGSMAPRQSFFLSAIFCLLAAGILAAQPVSLRARRVFDPGVSPRAAAVDDFNRDGKPDLVVAGDRSSILLGNGDGTFGSAAYLGLEGPAQTSVATGDFNGDGNPDLVFASSDAGTLSVLLGRGDGTFLDPATIPVGVGASFIAVGDFNGDGILDLAISNSSSGSLSVMLGNGDGTFQPPTNYQVGQEPASIATGDFNGDGSTDLAVANRGSNDISILINDGDGTFEALGTMIVDGKPYSVVAGDFNGDGWQDLAVASVVSDQLHQGRVQVLLGKGNGTFQPPGASMLIQGTPSWITVSDFNKDGKPDLAVAQSYSGDNRGAVSVLLGNGDGTFMSAGNPIVDPGPVFVGASDFNADGNPDLVTAGGAAKTISVTLGNGDGFFQTAMTLYERPDADLPSVAVGDFDGDGHLDALVSFNYRGQFGSLVLWLGNGDGTFRRASQEPPCPGSPICHFVIAGDFDRDGKLDYAVTSGYSSIVALGNGDGTFRQVTKYFFSGTPASIKESDLNGDGYIDLVVSFNTNVAVLLGNGDGTFQPARNFDAGISANSMGIGDLNNDGILDLAVAGGGGFVSVLLGNGDGTFQPPSRIDLGAAASDLVIGDLNHDGAPDLAVASGAGGAWILFGNGDGTFQTPVAYPLLDAPKAIALADMNGDGAPDIVTANSSFISVLLGNGDGTFQPAVYFGTNGNPRLGNNAVAAADFNEDGRPDLITLSAYGDISVLLSVIR